MQFSGDKHIKKEKIAFPKNFFWGAATSSHQVEGGTHNNWSEWEKKNANRLAKEAGDNWNLWQKAHFPEMFEAKNYISGKACDHFNRFSNDFSIAKKLGHNAHRFSIEWSRIEPKEGVFDKKAIEHYKQVLRDLRAKGITPFVTLWHWTNPLWLTEMGGEENRKFGRYFSRYASHVVRELGAYADFWITLNEPTSVIGSAYMKGAWPPQKKDIFSVIRVFKNLSRAHKLSYDEIHRIQPTAKVGFSNISMYIEPFHRFSPLDRIMARIVRHFANKEFLNLTHGKNDFLAVQYYFHKLAKFPRGLSDGSGITSDLGWEICPKGIYYILKKMKKYNLPVYVTENGLADADDSRRAAFIKNHLYWVHKAISEGVDVRGYFYWSLLDNFEWDKGFWPRFGLVEVDFLTMERKIRPSAWEYAKICKNNGFEMIVKNRHI
ncbi:MAG: glycoside hydrolase family 1 protein [Candidatus Moranbacteria bacterium]|nr:glycoside hydrolase family 1 protein [Candidatus Moranbacteria bacterium]